MCLGTEPLNKTKSLFNYSEENPTINLFFSINPLSFTVKLGLVHERKIACFYKKYTIKKKKNMCFLKKNRVLFKENTHLKKHVFFLEKLRFFNLL